MLNNKIRASVSCSLATAGASVGWNASRYPDNLESNAQHPSMNGTPLAFILFHCAAPPSPMCPTMPQGISSDKPGVCSFHLYATEIFAKAKEEPSWIRLKSSILIS